MKIEPHDWRQTFNDYKQGLLEFKRRERNQRLAELAFWLLGIFGLGMLLVGIFTLPL